MAIELLTEVARRYASDTLDYLLGWSKLIQNREVGWLTMDRKTGNMIREQQPLFQKLRLLLLFNPFIEWLDRTWIFRYYLHENSIKEGKRETNPRSKSKIQPFVEFYGIDMTQFQPSDINAYETFEDFFVREHTAESRPIYKKDDDAYAIVPADCRVVVYPSVHMAQKLWIKGRNFSLTNLLGDEKLAEKFVDGPIASFRLSPQDYHRYHSPVTGKVKWWKKFGGEYYNVDPLNLRSHIDVLTTNARCVVCLETEKYGDVVFVAIGATDVGTVNFNDNIKIEGTWICKGDEIGRFEFGGSSIIVAFEKGRIDFDDDLLERSKEKIMVDVEYGMSLGRLQEK